MTSYSLAVLHSLTCFMNSLLRERFNYSIENNILIFKVSASVSLKFPLKKFSTLGRHKYTGEIYLTTNHQETAIEFLEAARLIVRSLISNPEKITELTETFIARLKNSVENIQLSLEKRQQDIEELYQTENITFAMAEQGLFIGHNFHPYPKMREGFGDDDYSKYSPEMAAKFKLLWVAVKPENLMAYDAATFEHKSWATDLLKLEGWSPTPGYLPLPMHPWQFHHLQKNGVLDSFLQSKNIIVLGEGVLDWYPTSSLRSIYSPQAPYMLKFSLSLKLTNSIRHLTDVEVVRGMQVHDVLNSKAGQEFKNKHPEFEVISEPSFLGLKNIAGQTLTETLVVARMNPFTADQTNNVLVSTLAQDHPLRGENLIVKNVKDLATQNNLSLAQATFTWFKAYLDCCVLPLIDGQANFGFLLGAHQQNLIISLKNHLPVKGYFRDCQGTGYSELGFSLYSQEVPSLVRSNGNVLDEKGNILFGYYLMINSTFNVIAALAESDAVEENELLQILKKNLMAFEKTEPRDKSFLNYILHSKEIYHKGNFYCSIENINENTATNPLAIYNLIPNPLFVRDNHESI